MKRFAPIDGCRQTGRGNIMDVLDEDEVRDTDQEVDDEYQVRPEPPSIRWLEPDEAKRLRQCEGFNERYAG